MRAGPQRRKSRVRGATLVEFAVTALVFLTTLFGCFELSRLVLIYTTVANASRVGIRTAIVNGTLSGGSSAAVAAKVKDFAAAAALNRDDVDVTVTPSTIGLPGSTVQVVVSYSYRPITFVPISAFTMSTTTQGVVTY